MTVVEIKHRWPEPNEFDVICDACGQSTLPDERQPCSDASDALEAADKQYALVRDDDQVRCQGCVQRALCSNGPGTCDGGGLVQWNTSRSGRDPQCDMDAPCPGCVNCEFMDGLVDAKGDAMPVAAVTTSGTKGGRS